MAIIILSKIIINHSHMQFEKFVGCEIYWSVQIYNAGGKVIINFILINSLYTGWTSY